MKLIEEVCEMDITSVEKFCNIKDIENVLDEINKFPFQTRFLRIVEESNDLKKEYIIVKDRKQKGIFIIYNLKLNIFTFNKFRFHYQVKIIGVPCSISKEGYYGENIKSEIFERIKEIKGLKLILNCNENNNINGFSIGKTLPSSVLEIRWCRLEDYLSCLRSNYRYRLKKALKLTEEISVNFVEPHKFTNEMYELYENVFNKSNFKLEKLKIDFFNNVNAKIISFDFREKPVGFVQLFENKEELIFLFCGMDYNYPNYADLYLCMLLEIVRYAIENGFKFVDFGQTSENSKQRFGAKLVPKFFYVNHYNKILNFLIGRSIRFMEYNNEKIKYSPFRKDSI